MPVALRSGRFAVKVYGPPREHAPPHVHVFVGTEGIVVVRLPSGTRPIAVRQIEGAVRDRDVRTAVNLVLTNAALLLDAWNRLHG